jgi:hypothetical protein
VGIGRVDVAECALDRVSLINRAAAACGKQQVNGLGAQGCGKSAVAPVTRSLF